MKKLSKSFVLGIVLTLFCLPPLHAQQRSSPPADTKTAAANPSSSAQAPDEVTNKITELVHDGKYVEAQQLTTGLLLAYPGDQRLIKAKALLDKLLAPAGSAPGTNPPTNNAAPAKPTANADAQPLTGMDKVDYDALIELAKQAQQTTDLEQQKTLLLQFMDQSSLFLQKRPTTMLLWQLRAASAISLDDPTAGYDAGQQLLALGAAYSNDSNVQRLLAQLKNKGWLDKQKVQALLESAEAARLKAVHDQYTFPVERPLGVWRWSPNGYGHVTINENDLVYDGSDGRVQLSKSEIRRIDFFPGLIVFIPKDGKSLDLFPATEDAVTQKVPVQNLNLPATAVENAVLERWKFVADAGNRWRARNLKPPPESGSIGGNDKPR
jgi:hypothetical protein